jgi:hypothetical protein
MSLVVSPSLTFRTDVQLVQMPAKQARERGYPYTLADDIARSIRCHIRVLSRVIAGLAEEQPADLVDALIAAIRAVPLKIQGHVSIAPFAPRYEIEGAFAKHDRPIAADIGAALTALRNERGEVTIR